MYWQLMRMLKIRYKKLVENSGYGSSYIRGYEDAMKLCEEYASRHDNYNLRLLNYDLKEQNDKLKKEVDKFSSLYKKFAALRIENKIIKKKKESYAYRLMVLQHSYPDIYNDLVKKEIERDSQKEKTNGKFKTR